MLTKLNVSLQGFRVGISGAVPNREEWTEVAQDVAILEFVALLSGVVFQYGGHLIHGSHPTLTPVILRQAELHASDGSNRLPVTLVMSDLFAKSLSPLERERFERETNFLVTPQVGQGGPEIAEVRNKSLTTMRRQLIQEMNVMISVGGKQHASDNLTPGLAEELQLARDRGMPCFLVGGFGGMAAQLARSNSAAELFLRNGMSVATNIALLSTRDITSCVSIIFDHLISHPELQNQVEGGGSVSMRAH